MSIKFKAFFYLGGGSMDQPFRLNGSINDVIIKYKKIKSPVDPITPLCAVAKEYGVWVYIDAAYARSACICPEFRHFINGVEDANSFGFNAHKWFFTTLDCCCLWVKDPSPLVKALSTSPEYLRNKATESKQVIDYKDWQIALSRRFQAMKL
uniref:Uncharacterized protein n=1 Tax=Nelumbo nucifera TaxID=4432 RepID=A0A822ZEF4_NELNU|nr:TPA_asm: hypothetical protein HUJ06_016152 [Nelumbo nucifera]